MGSERLPGHVRSCWMTLGATRYEIIRWIFNFNLYRFCNISLQRLISRLRRSAWFHMLLKAEDERINLGFL